MHIVYNFSQKWCMYILVLLGVMVTCYEEKNLHSANQRILFYRHTLPSGEELASKGVICIKNYTGVLIKSIDNSIIYFINYFSVNCI